MNDDHILKTIGVYDTIADDYARKIDAYAPHLEREKFVSLIPSSARILDAGCGPGRDCEYFVKQGLMVIGVDLSIKLLDIAKKRVPKASFLKQDLRMLDFPLSSFDGIWACASLHHLKRDEVPNVLQRFNQLLKSGGILFISVKEGNGEEDVVEPLSSGLPRHFIYYSEHELRILLSKAGFINMGSYTYREKSRRTGQSNLVWVASFSKKQ